WPIDSRANRRPAISARNMPLPAGKSPNVFSPQDVPTEPEHEQSEPSRVKKTRDDPPNGIAAAQVLIHHVPGDLHPRLLALARGTSPIRWVSAEVRPLTQSRCNKFRKLEHDPEKCEAVFRKDHAQNNNLKRDDDSSQSHRALV